MSGVHIIEVTYLNGTTKRIDCVCELCQAWRELAPRMLARFEARMREMEPEVRPEWLGGEKP